MKTREAIDEWARMNALPGCVLRISGPYAELGAAVREAFVTFAESRASVLERERAGSGGPYPSTYNYTVSDADGDHVPQQIRDAEVFVSEHLDELILLRSHSGIESGVLDFGWCIPSGASAQFNRFPSRFMSLCAEAKLDVEVSVYVVNNGKAEA